MPKCSIFRHHNLVLTVSYSSTDGYEILVEIDTDEDAASVPVLVATDNGELARIEL